MNHVIFPICGMIILAVGISFIAVNGSTSNTISLDNSNRREYTYCPINDELSKTNIEINGCPLTRVYVNDWNRLTVGQQTQIDSQLRALGFVDAGEHILR